MKHLFIIFIRFIFGAPLSGNRRTNHTIFHRGTKDLTLHGRTRKWGYLSAFETALIRLAIVVAISGIIYEYFRDPERAITLGIELTTALIILMTMWSYVRIITWNHRRKIVNPTVNVLRRHLNYDGNEKINLRIPRNYRTNPNMRITLKLPADYQNDGSNANNSVKRIISMKTGIPVVAEYDMIGKPIAVFKHAPSAPSAVNLDDIMPYILSNTDGQLAIGFDNSNSIVNLDLESESPHIALGIGTGGGKSSLIRVLILGLIAQGIEQIDILDVKSISQDWAKEIPGVFIHTLSPIEGHELDSIKETIHSFAQIMRGRYTELMQDTTLTFKRRVLIIEEQNSLMEMIKKEWMNIRTSKDPRESPTLSDYGYILFQARQAKMNVISALQYTSARAMGGGDLRSQYAAFILSRASKGMWRMVWDERKPRTSRRTGHSHLIVSSDIRELQLAFASEKECMGVWPTLRSPEWTITNSDIEPYVPEERYNLAEISRMNVIPTSYDNLRKWKSKDPNFPHDYGDKKYRVSEIETWWRIKSGTENVEEWSQ